MIENYAKNEFNCGWYIWMYNEDERRDKVYEQARLNANHAKVCSCWMCCNEKGVSKQEYKARWLEAESKEEADIQFNRPKRNFTRY